MNNLHLIPEILINIADKFKTSKHTNEKFNLQLRLEACRDYVINALEGGVDKSDKYSKFFKKKD